MRHTDTIVAVGSPPGRSARGLVRVSGPRSREVVRRWLADGVALPPPRRMTAVRLRTPPLPAMLLLFEAGASFTGEDAAELQVPGNPALLDRLLAEVTLGDDPPARLAEAGEFTFRGFTHGRIDLTRAEGIAATIAAANDAQLRAAALLRNGAVGRLSERLVDQVATLLALVEAGIDFTDQEDVVPITPAALDRGLVGVEAELRGLLARSRSWGSLTSLPRVVLSGPPSSGKSTLFNALLGRERAVVDEAPGTTRDVLEEEVTLAVAVGVGVEMVLVDVAGVGDGGGDGGVTADELSRDAELAAGGAVGRADLVLMCGPPFTPPPSGVRSLWVVTKSDVRGLERGGAAERVPAASGGMRVVGEVGVVGETVHVSAHTGEGLDVLRRAVAEALERRGGSVAADMLALQPRHEAALRGATQHVALTRRLLAPQREAGTLHAMELVAGHMRRALDELASLGGAMSPDDVIGRVFATFCVGK